MCVCLSIWNLAQYVVDEEAKSPADCESLVFVCKILFMAAVNSTEPLCSMYVCVYIYIVYVCVCVWTLAPTKKYANNNLICAPCNLHVCVQCGIRTSRPSC